MKRALGIFLVVAAAVVAVDLLLQTTLFRLFWPVIVSPTDGAIASPPVVVRWEGEPAMKASLGRGGRRQDLGLRHSPFAIDSSLLPRAGQYLLQLESPTLGPLVRVERRFRVERVEAEPAVEAKTEPQPADTPALQAEIDRLEGERRRAEAASAALQRENEELRRDNRDLETTVRDLEAAEAETDARLGVVESQQAELLEQHLATVEQNRTLRARLESLPACTTWGYVSLPRPQTSIPTRRVVVSNVRGEIFQSLEQCHRSRQGDPTAASACFCVGSVWN